jgi:hypothetical protein
MGRDAAVLRLRGPGLQVADLLRKVLGGEHRIGVERLRGPHVAARRAADAEVDACRRQRFQDAELLGDLERRIVRQHDAGAADADAPGARRDRGHQDLGRAAHDGGQAVVFAEPEAVVAERFAVFGQAERVANRLVFTAAGDGDGLIEHGKFHRAHSAQGAARACAGYPSALVR